MSPRDRWESGGPSYWDVDAALQELRDRYGVGTRFEVTPPIRRLGDNRRSSWCVSLQVWTLGKGEAPRVAAQESFGNGGAWKTLPSAMLQAVLTVRQKLEDRERDAAEQAAF